MTASSATSSCRVVDHEDCRIEDFYMRKDALHGARMRCKERASGGAGTDLEVEVDLHPHEAVKEGLDLLLRMMPLPNGGRGGLVRERSMTAPAASTSLHKPPPLPTPTHRVQRPPVPLRQRVRPRLRVLLLQPARVLRLPQRHGQQRRLRRQRAVAADAVDGGRGNAWVGWRLLLNLVAMVGDGCVSSQCVDTSMTKDWFSRKELTSAGTRP